MTPEQIIELADDCGANVYKYQSLPGHSSIEFGNEALMKFAKLIEAATREECARVCDVTPPQPFRPSIEAAHAIRSMK